MPLQILPSLASTHVAFAAVALLALSLLRQRSKSKQSLPYPPGPTPLPLIGNILNMPMSKFALKWTEFGEEYGPLTWLKIPGQNVLVINSFEVAKDLLEKRASIYADRPRFTMITELLGLADYFPFRPYDAKWKKQRAHLQAPLSAGVVRSENAPLMERQARDYLLRCLARPESAVTEINRIVAETIIKLTYGRLEDDRGRDYIQINTHVADVIVQGIQGLLVDLVPGLRYLPEWLPGMKFKRDAARWRAEISDLEHTVFESAKENLLSEDPDVRASFMYKKLQELYEKQDDAMDVQQRTEDEMNLARSGLVFFLAGVETTQAMIESFVCAMTLFPSVQKAAQAEIGRAVGPNNAPSFEDLPNLPYLHAVVLETLRWNPVGTFGIPHASSKDDVYNGYFIPKGTSIIANAWGISRNPKYYTNPTVFDPERHLKQKPELDPREFYFGYGRRICPGKDLAFQLLSITVASILWAFHLAGPDDSTPPADDVDRFSFGLISAISFRDKKT
ncbi:hypothetical protein FRB90_011131 [Tulasnella sp. 427]|nr:hypothetical protein FRB90_011131 [Tulasnella sp. 427]